MKRIVSAAVVAALLSAPAIAAAPKVGAPAPHFTMKLIDGSEIQSEDLRGQVVVINFWATWCVPCKKELPTLDTFLKATQQHGLRVFAVTTEDSVGPRQLKPLFDVMTITPVRRIKGPLPILGAVPTNYVIDRAGVVRYAKAAALDLDAMNAILIPLLREKAPETIAAR